MISNILLNGSIHILQSLRPPWVMQAGMGRGSLLLQGLGPARGSHREGPGALQKQPSVSSGHPPAHLPAQGQRAWRACGAGHNLSLTTLSAAGTTQTHTYTHTHPNIYQKKTVATPPKPFSWIQLANRIVQNQPLISPCQLRACLQEREDNAGV